MPATVGMGVRRPSLTSAIALCLAVLVMIGTPLPASAIHGGPHITSVYPNPPIVPVGGTISISGTDLGGPSGGGSAQVFVNDIQWAISAGDDYFINVVAPTDASTGQLRVQTTAGTATYGSNVTIVLPGAPQIVSTTPGPSPTLVVGDVLRVNGTDLRGVTATATVAGIDWPIVDGDDTFLDVVVPSNADHGSLTITNEVGPSVGVNVYVRPNITGTDPSPLNVYPGGYLFVYGTRLGGSNGSVFIGSTQLATDWTFSNTDTQLRVVVPDGIPGGQLSVFYDSFRGYGDQVTIGPVPTPVLDSVAPATVTVTASTMTIQASGSGFISTSKLYVDGSLIGTTVNSGTQLTGYLATATLATAGTHDVYVNNPATSGGGNSATLTFATRLQPLPVLGGVTPSAVTVSANSVEFIASGADFEPTSFIQFGSTLLNTTFVSPTELRGVTVTATVGSFDVRVYTPSPNGGTSSPISVNVTSAPTGLTPVLGSLEPSAVTITASAVVVGALGSGFEAGAVVLVDGVQAATTLVDATELEFTIQTSTSTLAGDRTITVRNPGGQTSSPQTLTLENPVPIVSGTTPVVGTAATGQTFTFTGSGFTTSTQVFLGANEVDITSLSFGQIQAFVPSSAVPQGITLTATVRNPAPGGGELLLDQTFLSPAPNIASLAPTFGLANGPSFTLVLNGTFSSDAVIFVNGNAFATTYLGPTALSTTIPDTLLTVTGTAHAIQVCTITGLGGGFSQVRSLPVLAAPPTSDTPPPVATLPDVLDLDLVLFTDDPFDLPLGGTVTARVVQSGEGGTTVTFDAGTTVFGADGEPFGGLLRPPTFVGTLLDGLVRNGIRFDEPDGPLTFDRPVTITLPVPLGANPFRYQGVFVDGSRLVYLPGTVTGTAVAFDTLHFSTFGLVEMPLVPVVSVTPSYVQAEGFHARWAGQSEYVTLRPGQETDLTVRYVNAGDRTWVRGALGTAQADLGASAPRDNTRDFDRGILVSPYLNPDRFAAMTETSVAPGETATFTFRARAPLSAGVYRIELGIVIDGVSWLEDEGVYLQVTVAE